MGSPDKTKIIKRRKREREKQNNKSQEGESEFMWTQNL